MQNNNVLPLTNNQQIGKAVLSPNNEPDIFTLGQLFYEAGMFKDMKNAAQCGVKILAGREMGIPAYASMSAIHIINDKPTLSANVMAALIKKSGKYNYTVLELSNAVCELEFFEQGKSCGKSKFTIEDAQTAQVTNNPTWKKYPKNMLFARAISNGARWYCPDLFAGGVVYTPEEMGAEVNEDGEYQPEPAKPLQLAPKQIEAPKQVREVAREVSPIADEDTAEKLRIQIERKDLYTEIGGICKEITLAGNEGFSTPRKLKEYINSNWVRNEGLDSLNIGELIELKTKLEAKLAAAKAADQPAF